MIKAVIFDMDGVIVDSEYAFLKKLREYLLSKNIGTELKDLYYLSGIEDFELYSQIAKLSKSTYEETRVDFKKYYNKSPMVYKDIQNEDTVEAIKILSGKFPLALASSSDMGDIDTVLDTCFLRRYFSVVTSGQSFKESKPNPEIYLHTAGLLKIRPEECLAVEDSNYGVRAAYNAKMHVVARKDPHIPNDISLADFIVDDCRKIYRVIEKIDKNTN
ncbi:MAG: HAD family phosphatase [Bacillota bacterium]|nr:HAD family phosphatase [Bacillota bacterium]